MKGFCIGMLLANAILYAYTIGWRASLFWLAAALAVYFWHRMA